MTHLTKDDAEKLVKNASPETRATTAAKLASDLIEGSLSLQQRKIAEDIVAIMAKDTATIVRRALSEHLKNYIDLPKDIALQLANDVDVVALPILQFSEVLSDEDLLDIIKHHGQEKQLAIAGRSSLSEVLSEALIETKNKHVVIRVLDNQGAQISESSYQNVITHFEKDEDIQKPMALRTTLPVKVLERLLNVASDGLKNTLITRHHMPDTMANDIILQVRERAIMGLSTQFSLEGVEQLVNQLFQTKQLTPSLLLRALCLGDVIFFEMSLSKLARVSLNNTARLVYDEGDLGFGSLYDKSGLPQEFKLAFHVALEVVRETEEEGTVMEGEKHIKKIIERIMTYYEDMDDTFDSETISFLLNKLNDLHPAALVA